MHDRPAADELTQLLSAPAYQKLLIAAREHIEKHGESARAITLRALTTDERAAIAGLLGLGSMPAETLRLPLAKIDQALRESRLRVGLHEALIHLGGPLIDRRAVRAAYQQSESLMWAEAERHAALQRQPQLRGWLNELRSRGLLYRAARATGRAASDALNLLLDLLNRVPLSGALLPVLAMELTGDTHALDRGQPLRSLLIRAVACLCEQEPPTSAAEQRVLLARVGILSDPLSCDVLTLGLRPLARNRLALHLRQWAEEGEPRRLTLRELNGAELALEPGSEVFVCENPGIVAAAADRLGSLCSALICTDGVPSTAVLRLIHALRPQHVRFHVDFDWAGLRIGNQIARHAGAVPWRMGTADYLHAVQRGGDEVALRGHPAAASWDAELQLAMQRVDRAVFEESVLEDLLDDLGAGSV